MRKQLIIGMVWMALLVVAGGCSKFRRIQKSDDWRIKYEAGLNYYEKKDYYRTSILFEEILPVVRGLPEGERVEFVLAYCQYYQRLYLVAANQFRTFYETYARSASAQEAFYMYAYSLYVASPDAYHDQKSSVEAMNAMQTFLNQFPDSKYRDQAIEVINASQQKLETKGFENARQYYKIRSYKAAVIAFENFRKSFPDSKLVEDALYYKVIAEFRLAEQSLPSLQLERYNEVVSYYMEFLDTYPDSKRLKDAQEVYSSSLEKINRIKANKKS